MAPRKMILNFDKRIPDLAAESIGGVFIRNNVPLQFSISNSDDPPRRILIFTITNWGKYAGEKNHG
jgi:hypothetical protein